MQKDVNQEQEAEAWGLHPFFERLLRTDVSPGAATGVSETYKSLPLKAFTWKAKKRNQNIIWI